MQALRCRQRFGLGHTFSYRKQIQNGLLEAIPQNWITRCSIRKILRSIVTLVKINLFESALLGWVLGRSKAEDLQTVELANNSLLEDEYDCKVFQLILIRAYYVKSYLAEDKVPSEIDTEILTILPNFSQLYANWKPEKSLKHLTHTEINKIFESWIAQEPQKKKVDYNNMVDRILFFSKTYNVGTSDEPKDKQLRKKRKHNEKSRAKDSSSSNAGESIRFEQKRDLQKLDNRYMDSGGKHSFNDPWEQNVFKNEIIQEMNPLRRSSRQIMLRSIPFGTPDMQDSRHNLFESKRSQRMFGSLLVGSNPGGLQLKATNSFDQLKEPTPKQ